MPGRKLLPAFAFFLSISACAPGSGIGRHGTSPGEFETWMGATERLRTEVKILEERIGRLEEQRPTEAFESKDPIFRSHERAIERLNAAVDKILDMLDLMLQGDRGRSGDDRKGPVEK